MTAAGHERGKLATRDELEIVGQERRRVEEALAEISEAGVRELPPKLRAPVDYALSTTGKRIRPVLCVLAYSAARPKKPVPKEVYRLACAIEIVHTYSLIHDDLPCMDDDDLRRGRPTVHRVFGPAYATLAGAALLPLAVETLEREGAGLGLDLGTRARLVAELMGAAGAEGMVGGQLLDLEGERKQLGAADLERIHRKKTGVLLTSSLRIGAIVGKSSPDLLDALTRYGEALGLAFQIADDVLDIEGDPVARGKAGGRDAELRKSSYPGIHGLEGARTLAREKSREAKEAVGGLGLPHLEELADFVVERYR